MLMIALLQIYFGLCCWMNLENRPVLDEILTKNLAGLFLGHLLFDHPVHVVSAVIGVDTV